MTETGMSLGTPHYMSPEQAMGEREITARSDVYALGAMTYEMLVGEPPFTGPTAQAIVAKVLTEEPRPLVPRRRSIPPEVEEAVLTALEKLPADRFGSAAGVRGRAGRSGARSRRTRPRARPRRAGASVVAPTGSPLVAGAAALAVAGYLARRPPVSRPPRCRSASAQCIKVTWDPGLEVLPAISPDGKTVAYASGSAGPDAGLRPAGRRRPRHRAHRRHHPGPVASALVARRKPSAVPRAGRRRAASPPPAASRSPEVPPGRNGPVISAAWSPDGKRIAYVVGDSLFVRDARGESRGIARVFEANGCVWSPDGAYVACSSGNAISLTVGDAVRQRVAQPGRQRARRRRAGRADHRQPLAQSEPGLVAGRALALLRLQPLRPARHLRPGDVRRDRPRARRSG